MVSWTRLICFSAPDGVIHNGEPIVTAENDDVGKLFKSSELKARIIEGDDVFSDTAKVTEEVVEVDTLLGPLSEEQVPIVRCVGLNYMKHNTQRNRPHSPPHPSIFIKPSTSISDWGSDIPIPKLAQDDQADYEGELTIVIGKPGKNIPLEKAHKHIAGYVTSNDVSVRKWQREKAYAGGVPQFDFWGGGDCEFC
ncbi:hypothetical protein BDD12DRAFT_795034 [Trichophaea hybrida]|nr:hypothetical protein BDD12DRAFT_795034 [Trichophaea hybrida]